MAARREAFVQVEAGHRTEQNRPRDFALLVK
jgi:hypothetical protein